MRRKNILLLPRIEPRILGCPTRGRKHLSITFNGMQYAAVVLVNSLHTLEGFGLRAVNHNFLLERR
jgi:hypothetical protein